MDDGLNREDNKGLKMGASSNPNSAKIATLQDRKKVIEETLAKHNQELRQLCIQEAELTGMMPEQYPLEPGETPPSFRRRVGTSFQLSQSLLNNLNNNAEEITTLELEMQILAQMAEAALGLANENNGNKTVRRTHMADYQHHKQRYNAIEEKLLFLKTRMQMAQQPKQPSPVINHQPKQKKKPRPPDQEDAVSMNTSDPFGKTNFRHSLRSLQHPPVASENVEYRYSMHGHQRLAYRGSDSASLNENAPQYLRHDDPLMSSFYKLNMNGYKEYVNRQDSPIDSLAGSNMQNQYHSQSSNSLYKQPGQYVNSSHTLPHARRSPQQVPQMYPPQYQQYNPHSNSSSSLHRQASPSTSSSSSVKYYPMQSQVNYKSYSTEQNFRNSNPHQLQPHQQYEHDVMTSGLGGYWKRLENGEMFWCNSSSSDTVSQKDKRFGSLDRRKNKRVQKRISPNVDPKSATLATVPMYSEPSRTLPSKAQQVVSRHRQDSRQLVRTQSLGSVGGQTIDSVCPSDDSSCGSETLSYNEQANIRKHKEKEWYETALDGPPNSIPPSSRSHSTVPSIAPEDKYVDYPSPLSSPRTPTQVNMPHPPFHSPQTPKILEIPAESNPSPRISEANLEIFNNNIPRNGTVIQHAQWKPYHEETKPFEMSDFYKYSTKFKRSPQKVVQEEVPLRSPSVGFRNLPSPQGNLSNSDTYDDDSASVIQKGVYTPLQPMKCQPFSPVSNSSMMGSPLSLNSSLDLSQLAPNVAENFSAEMNAWYQNHEHQNENNNATLV